MKGIAETEERGKLGRREGQRLKESLLLEEDMGGGLLLHWDQTVGAGASIGPAHHRLNQRETAMRYLFISTPKNTLVLTLFFLLNCIIIVLFVVKNYFLYNVADKCRLISGVSF